MALFKESQDTDNNPFNCQHYSTYPHGKTEKCASCGAVYDDILMEWVYEGDE